MTDENSPPDSAQPDEDALPAPKHWLPVKCAIAQIANAVTGPRFDVVILGAGMSGLCAAIELAKNPRIRKIDIYEATDNRVGGRVWTHRLDGEKQYAELGAMRIPLRHDYTVHYMREVAGPDSKELKIRPFYNGSRRRDEDFFEATDGEGKIHIFRRDRFADRRFITEVFGALREDEFRLLAYGNDDKQMPPREPNNLLKRSIEPLMATLADNDAMARALVNADFEGHEPWRATLRAWDQMTFEDYLKGESANLSKAALGLLCSTISLSNIWHWSLAVELRGSLTNAPLAEPEAWRGLWEIAGGLDRLPRGMRRLLEQGQEYRDKVTFHFAHEVVGLHRVGSRGTVRLRNRKTNKETTLQIEGGRRVLCTVPFGVLRSDMVELRGFSEAKMTSIRELTYASATKVVLWSRADRLRRPFWASKLGIHEGRSVTDRKWPVADRERVTLLQSYYPGPVIAGLRPPLVKSTAPAARSDKMPVYWNVTCHVEVPQPSIALAQQPASGPPRLDVLASYSFGHNAEALGKLTFEERARQCETMLSANHSVDLGLVMTDHWVSMAWHEYRWTRGALGKTPPGELSTLYRGGRQQEGYFYFAGEHISIAPGWIQGACESGLAAAHAMLTS